MCCACADTVHQAGTDFLEKALLEMRSRMTAWNSRESWDSNVDQDALNRPRLTFVVAGNRPQGQNAGFADHFAIRVQVAKFIVVEPVLQTAT